MTNVCNNAYKQYLRSRPTPDSESIRNVKQIMSKNIEIHPIFRRRDEPKNEIIRKDILDSIRSYRPNSTIFETGKTKGSVGFEVMKNKRKICDKIVKKFGSNKDNLDQNHHKYKDNEFYVPYQSSEHFSEKGLELDKPFNAQMASAVLDLNGDESQTLNRSNSALKWDRKKKRFINSGNTDKTKKKIKTESGNWISATYKSDLYQKWKQKSKAEEQEIESEEDMNEEKVTRNLSINQKDNKKVKSKRPPKRELKNREEIYKERQRLERKKSFQKWRQSEKSKRSHNKKTSDKKH